jgi:Outer membrane protein beta-barrel domain
MQRRSAFVLALLLALVFVPASARADGFISPYLGLNFGADTTEKSTIYGGAVGFIGDNGGFELDFGYTPDFFGEDESPIEGKVVTAMGNILIGGRRSGFAPYLAFGAGVIRTSINDDLLDLDAAKNSLGGNVGGGFFIGGGSFTVRGDARYFRAFDYEGFDDFDFRQDKLSFWRATVGVGLMW